MTKFREVYDANEIHALGSDKCQSYGRVASAMEAINCYKSAQSHTTLGSGYIFSVQIVNGVYAVTMEAE